MTRSSTVYLGQTTRISLAGAIMAIGLAIATYAAAQDSAAGRYTMHKTEDGFVRLDTQTGAVSLCRKEADAWSCRDIADATPPQTQENGGTESNDVVQLRRENRALREEITRLEELLGLRDPPAGQPPKPHGFKLPTEKDVDQAFDYFESMLRKFQERLKRLEKEQAPGPERQL
jgi:hypothetical protein